MKKYYLLLMLCSFSFLSFGQLRESPEVDSLFLEWENNQSPGAAIGIIKEGKLIYSKGYGIANLDYGIPITPDSKFYIASTSKQFTAACIALLSLEGKIGLDDNIRDYLPEIPDYGKEITIRHLVHHTSGLRDYLVLMYLAGESFEDYFSIGDGIKKLEKQKALNFSPGEKEQYSNSGYMLLAEIVNRASGMTIRQYAEKNIFQPLGMQHTFFNDDHKQITKNRVISYLAQGEGTYKRFLQNFDALGDGNLLTTINDLYLWDQNFYTQIVGGEKFKDITLSPGVLNNGDVLQYAFGLIHGEYKGLKTISHSGFMLGFSTQYIRFPEQGFSVIILANRSDANASFKASQVADILLKDKFSEESQTKKIEPEKQSDTPITKKFALNELTGNYENLGVVVLEVTVKNDSLHVLQRWDKSSHHLVNTSGNRYAIPNDPSVQFVFSELKDGFTQGLTILRNGDATLCKRKEKREFPNLKLEDYTGDYYSEELDVSYFIFLEEGNLKVNVANRDAQELALYDLDTFTADIGLLRFNKSNGEVNSFQLDALGMTNLKFEKK